MLTTDRHATSQTLVPALAQCLRYGCAARTPLTGAGRVYLDQFSPSFFRFVRELGKETAPSGVINRLGQHPASQSLDIQILDRNQVVVVDQLAGKPVMKIRPLVSDMSVHPLESADCLPSPVASLLPAGYLPLSTPEIGLSLSVVAGVLDNRAVAQDREALQPNINSGDFSGIGQWLRDFNLDTEAGVPAPALSFQSHGLDLTRHWPVELDLQASNPLDVQLPVIPELAAVAINRQGVAVEATPGLEPWESSFLPSLAPAKEGLKSLIDPAQHILTSRVVNQAEISSRPNLFKLIGLVVVVHRYPGHAPGVPTLLKGGII